MTCDPQLTLVQPQVIELEGGKINYLGEHTAYEEQSLFYKEFLKNLANKKEEEPVEEKVGFPSSAFTWPYPCLAVHLLVTYKIFRHRLCH